MIKSINLRAGDRLTDRRSRRDLELRTDQWSINLQIRFRWEFGEKEHWKNRIIPCLARELIERQKYLELILFEN